MSSLGQISILLLLFLFATVLAIPGRRNHCKPIAPFCANLTKGYEQMSLPNFLGHDITADVTKGLLNWNLLVGARYGKKLYCPGRLLKMFLCSIYAPVCLNDTDIEIRPCRSLCVKARDTCEPVMKASRNLTWPSANNDAFNCSTYTDSSMCVGEIAEPPAVHCNADLTIDQLRKESCDNEFALKIELLKHKKETKGSVVLRVNVTKVSLAKNHKKCVNFIKGVVRKQRPLRLFFPANSGDECDHLFPSKESKSHYFVTGKCEDGGKKKKKLVLTAVLKWKRSYKKLLRINACSQKSQ